MKNKSKLRAVILSALMAMGLIAGATVTAGEASARIQNGCYWIQQNAMGQSSTAEATVHRGHLRINGMDAHGIPVGFVKMTPRRC